MGLQIAGFLSVTGWHAQHGRALAYRRDGWLGSSRPQLGRRQPPRTPGVQLTSALAMTRLEALCGRDDPSHPADCPPWERPEEGGGGGRLPMKAVSRRIRWEPTANFTRTTEIPMSDSRQVTTSAAGVQVFLVTVEDNDHWYITDEAGNDLWSGRAFRAYGLAFNAIQSYLVARGREIAETSHPTDGSFRVTTRPRTIEETEVRFTAYFLGYLRRVGGELEALIRVRAARHAAAAGREVADIEDFQAVIIPCIDEFKEEMSIYAKDSE